MKSHRRRIEGFGLTAVAAAACCAPPAQASSLLSGYGGPGQGSQAILGSALTGGRGGGSGSGGGQGGNGSSGANGSLVASGQTARASGAGPAPHAATRGAAGSPRSRPGASALSTPQARLAEAGAASARVYRELEHGARAPAAGPLGLTGADFAYIGMAVVALLLTAGLTHQLTRARPLKSRG